MRLGCSILALLLASEIFFAQEKPLGDIAREVRAQKHPSQPAKVFSNEDANENGVTDKDDPLAVVNRSGAALHRDISHRCRWESSGNSGPGWTNVRTVEVAGPTRIHIVLDETSPKLAHSELIIIGNEGYRRTGSGPWERMNAAETSFASSRGLTPDVLQFGYKAGDLRLVGRQVIDGASTFQYQFLHHSNEMDRTVDIWIGSNDNLPRKTQMQTADHGMGTSWTERTSCTYGANIKIEPPI